MKEERKLSKAGYGDYQSLPCFQQQWAFGGGFHITNTLNTYSDHLLDTSLGYSEVFSADSTTISTTSQSYAQDALRWRPQLEHVYGKEKQDPTLLKPRLCWAAQPSEARSDADSNLSTVNKKE